MASIVGRTEVDLTIRKLADKNRVGDPLNRPEGGSVKLRVYEENKHSFLTVKEALEKLNKFVQG